MNNYLSTCLLNNNYKSLLTKKRTSAAFNDSTKEKDELTPQICFKNIVNNGISEILDPMSGYGTIMNYGIKFGANTFMTELNLSAHLWQLIIMPKYNNILIEIVEELLNESEKFPINKTSIEVSENWFGEEGIRILTELYKLNITLLEKKINDKTIVEKLAIAILLPFVLNISTALKGDANHIKKGGVAVLKNYKEDYYYYLKNLLLKSLNDVYDISNQLSNLGLEHKSIYADAKLYKFPEKIFSGMLTSPPYPNERDYAKMFIAENYFIDYLYKNSLISFSIIKNHIIGTNVVKGRKDHYIETKVAIKFIEKLKSMKLKTNEKYDMDVYYIRYYQNYFSDIESAYKNVSKSLAEDFLGYIVVTNNHIRNIEVPVSDFVIELWQNLGFTTEIVKTKEVFHVGTKNPKLKGRMAKQTEYIIKVWRGKYDK